MATYAHTVVGSVLLCVPIGLVALIIFHAVRRPLCYLLPQPHRDALRPMASRPLPLTRQRFVGICASILLGAWTHLLLDSLTHRSGWIVQRLDLLQKMVFQIGHADFPVYQLLQHTGSTLGTVLLVYAYVAWLRRQPRSSRARSDWLSDRSRIIILALLAASALVLAFWLAAPIAAGFRDYVALRVFVFQSALYAISIFVPSVVLTALVLYARHRGLTSRP